MRRANLNRGPWLGLASAILVALIGWGLMAPEFLSTPDRTRRALAPFSDGALLGTDMRGIALTEYAAQGADIVALPSLVSGAVVAVLAMLAGVSRCASVGWTDSVLQAFSELVGALPRMVVILVVALGLPQDWRSLLPIGVTWAVLAAPGAMDEAAATAGRLGGAKFVEALRAHGFSAYRIYVYHILWLNLRPVIVRQAAEVVMQVVFLEIALSYLAVSRNQSSFTHSDGSYSWASLLYDGYTWLVGGLPMWHAMVVGLALVAVTAVMAQSFRMGARAR